jgi:transposase
MEILYTNCAGLDVHKKTVKVCVMTHASNGQLQKEFRTYFSTTEELLKLGDWLKEQGCTHIAEDRNRGVLETSVQPAGKQV